MNLQYDFSTTVTTEFGVGKDDGPQQKFFLMTVDADIQEALRDMALTTWNSMQSETHTPERYDPSEKHGGIEYLYLPLGNVLAKAMHNAANLPLNVAALNDPASVFCYFARMTDTEGRTLTALRRATQFKGALKKRFIRLHTNALKLVNDPLFKLDQDFDLLMDSAHLHILRPSGFEFAGKLQNAIMAAVPQNISLIQSELPFVEFAGIEAYAMKHPRAARYLASIQSQEQGKNIDKRALKALCKQTGVEIKESKGKLVVADAQIIGFLQVIDRRRYQVELVKGSPERYSAASRQKILNGGAPLR
jgi:Domain of unknown function (DUF4868)